jgi:glutamate racemase
MYRILVFDSGVGGLSIAAEIAALMPDAEIDYLADNGFFPYGTKPEAGLVDRIARVVGMAVRHIGPDCVVIACNTASTVALPRLRSEIVCPVVGVVPAVKPAAAQSRNRVIGLLGTPGTVRRIYTEELIERFATDCTVLRVGSTELVEAAEHLFEGQAVPPDTVERVLAPFFDRPDAARPDTIVLACTHFPLLREQLVAASPPGVAFIDSGRAVAERVRTLIGDLSSQGDGERRLFVTRDDAALRRRLPAFAARGYGRVSFLTVD